MSESKQASTITKRSELYKALMLRVREIRSELVKIDHEMQDLNLWGRPLNGDHIRPNPLWDATGSMSEFHAILERARDQEQQNEADKGSE